MRNWNRTKPSLLMTSSKSLFGSLVGVLLLLSGCQSAAASDPQTGGTCCPPPPRSPAVTVVDQEILPTVVDGDCVTPEWDVSAYRTLTIHTDRCSSTDTLQWKNGVAGFSSRGLVNELCAGVGRSGLVVTDTLKGRYLRINFPGTNCTLVKVTIVGYKDL